jgi:predicted DNA-binding transcriptional regulator AlpA
MTNQTRLPLDSKKAAAKAGVSRSTFWRGVASGRFPQPVYPMPGSPRWFDDELIAAVEKTRMSPAEAKEERRRCRLARDAAPPIA